MALDFGLLGELKKSHPAWRLFMADNSPMVASFLDREFREHNVRTIAETELVLHLDDYLHALGRGEAVDPFPKDAAAYLADWTHESRGWLRKFYPEGSDVPHYDLTPEAEKALSWMEQLSGKRFLGTEGRLSICIDLLRQIVHGREENRELRLRELKNRKRAIEDEIARLRAGEFSGLSDRELRERFVRFSETARELLGDFRAVEQNFIDLDRSIREEIALWDGEKSGMLSRILDRHDDIRDSDEGQSFHAFWDFIMSPASQDELDLLLDRTFAIPDLGDLLDDRRLRHVHFDWIRAGEQTQRRVARLSAQLRRYLDDQGFLENRRIMEILKSIERHAVALRDDPPGDAAVRVNAAVRVDAAVRVPFAMEIDGFKCDITLPLEYPLFSPPVKVLLDSEKPESGAEELDLAALSAQVYVDRERLERNIETCLLQEAQVSLGSLVARFPLELGLAELVAYFQIACERPWHVVDDSVRETVVWQPGEDAFRKARIPRILFCRKHE